MFREVKLLQRLQGSNSQGGASCHVVGMQGITDTGQMLDGGTLGKLDITSQLNTNGFNAH